MIALKYIAMRYKQSTVLRLLNLNKSTFYYKNRPGERGRKPTSYTMKIDGTKVEDGKVLEEINRLLSREFVWYGYRKITEHLKLGGWMIGKKKVYRIARKNKLLLPIRKIKGEKKRYVKHKMIKASKPFEKMEIDIKYVHIHGQRRNAYLLTILDLFSRKALGHKLAWSIRHTDVIELMKEVLMGYSPPTPLTEITLRSDNGSQFSAGAFREFLKNYKPTTVVHEFTHPYTPEENGHIESFHKLIGDELIAHYEFATLEQAQNDVNRYYTFYNNERLHSAIQYKSPEQYLQDYYKNEKMDSSLLPATI